ncbi:MAG: glycosyl transferase family [Flavipsychrobacter sp.]|jgi:glycosyltransferase involved in cell wall biosynthesis|nr:glycosyl transferase family [Flavipsychrobacter sp.]
MNGVFIHQQVKALQELGAECHVMLLHNWYPKFGLHKYHPHWQNGFEQCQSYFDEYEGVHVHHVPVALRMPDRLFKNDFYRQAAQAVVKYVKRSKQLEGADWLYAHFLTDYAYIGALAVKELKIKLAAIARGDDVHAWPEQQPQLVHHLKHVFANAHVLLANSGRLASDAQKWMDAVAIREVRTVYNGISHDKFVPVQSETEKKICLERFGLAPAYKYMICVATPVALKGWKELLTAVKNMGEQLANWKLLMVAPRRSAPDALDLEALSREAGVGDKTIYMGQLDPTELAKLYHASDLFVLPSYNEGMANSLLEAMASGLACVVTDVGGHAEVIENGKDGILVAPRNVAELENALGTACNNPALLQQYGVNARKRALEFGTYAENAKRLYDFLERYPKVN